MSRGLYLHIPFCLKHCSYCDFVITVKRSPELRQQFFDALAREMNEASTRYGRLFFDTVYLGGGTPSALSAQELESLGELIHAHFDTKPGCEFTCEINPGDGDESKIAALKRMGINRISMGAQAFQDRLLQHMNRPHNVRDIEETYQMIRRYDFKNISMDLICRLPGQTRMDWKESLDKILGLGPDQISIYDLDVHENTIYGAKQKRGELLLPGEDTHAEMFELAEEILEKHGYEQYEVFNFAKPGFESQHNLIYWTGQEYLGLGPGAFSYIEGVRYQFSKDIPGYLEKCKAGNWARDVEDVLTGPEKEKELMITGLRLKRGIRLVDFPLTKGSIEAKLPDLLRQGYVEAAAEYFRLTRKGRGIPESVMLELMGNDS